LFYLKEKNERVWGVILNKFMTDEFFGVGIKERYVKLEIERIKSVYCEKVRKDILGVIPHLQNW